MVAMPTQAAVADDDFTGARCPFVAGIGIGDGFVRADISFEGLVKAVAIQNWTWPPTLLRSAPHLSSRQHRSQAFFRFSLVLYVRCRQAVLEVRRTGHLRSSRHALVWQPTPSTGRGLRP